MPQSTQSTQSTQQQPEQQPKQQPPRKAKRQPGQHHYLEHPAGSPQAPERASERSHEQPRKHPHSTAEMSPEQLAELDRKANIFMRWHLHHPEVHLEDPTAPGTGLAILDAGRETAQMRNEREGLSVPDLEGMEEELREIAAGQPPRNLHTLPKQPQSEPAAREPKPKPKPTPTPTPPPPPKQSPPPEPKQPEPKQSPPPKPQMPQQPSLPEDGPSLEELEAEATRPAKTLGEALMRFSVEGNPGYEPEYNLDNPELEGMSSFRKRKIIRRRLISAGLLVGGTHMPEADPSEWPTANGQYNEYGYRISANRKGYVPGGRSNRGNPYGHKAFTLHPNKLSLREAWAELFNFNVSAENHNKLTDEDIVKLLSHLFPENPQRIDQAARYRTEYNHGRLTKAKPQHKLPRFGRHPIDPDEPERGFRVFELAHKGGIKKCLNDPGWHRRTRAGDKAKLQYPYPTQAPLNFKWWDGQIVSEEEFAALQRRKAYGQ